MEISKAVNRIKWRVENGGWKLDCEGFDMEAINSVIRYVNNVEEGKPDYKELFIKLYINTFLQFIIKYNTDVHDAIPVKELNKLLTQPLDYFVYRFTNRLNDDALIGLYHALGIKLEHPLLQSKDQNEQDMLVIMEAVKDSEKLKIYLGGAWEENVVKEMLFKQINHFLKNYHKNESNHVLRKAV